MKIEHMRECVAVADTLSFSQAADACFTSQSALSRHVQEVESELGVVLFERTTREVTLTEAGRKIIPGLRKTLDDYDDTLAKAGSTKGSLVIEVPYYWAEDFAEPLIERFSSRYPDCEIEQSSCQPAEGVDRVIAGISDVCLDCSTRGGDVLCRQPFSLEHVVVLVPADDPLADRDTIRPEELDGHGFVFIHDQSGYYDQFNVFMEDYLRSHGVNMDRIAEAQQIDTLGAAIKRTGYVATMTTCVKHMERSYLKVLEFSGDQLTFPMCVVWKRGRKNPMVERLAAVARAMNRQRQMHGDEA